MRNFRSGKLLKARDSFGPLAVVLGLVSIALPLLAFFGLEEPSGTFDDPAKVAYYRMIVLTFILGAALGLGAILLGRRNVAMLLKLPGIVLGTGGLVTSLPLLATLVGLCGPSVLRGLCNP